MVYDVVVIGGGLSGLVAAITAAGREAKVVVLTTGKGALSLSPGGIGLWAGKRAEALTVGGDTGEGEEVSGTEVTAKGETLEGTHGKPEAGDWWRNGVGVSPRHPYLLAGRESLRLGLQLFGRAMARYGNSYEPERTDDCLRTPRRIFALPTAIGGVSLNHLVPASLAAGDLGREEDMVIAGLVGLADFYPRLLTENLQRLQRPPFGLRHVYLDLGLGRLAPLHLAGQLEKETSLRTRMWRELRKVVHPGERIGLPGVLGRRGNATLVREWSAALGAPIFEIPLTSISLPGLRAWEGLVDVALKMGVDFRQGLTVTSAEIRGGICQFVEARTAGGTQRFYGRGFVLATGGLFGGGIWAGLAGDGQPHWRESIFGLPVALTAGAPDSSRAGLAGFNGLGLEVDDWLRPLLPGGEEVLAENLFAAGSLLGHYDPWKEGSGQGVAIATGYRAGALACGQLY